MYIVIFIFLDYSIVIILRVEWDRQLSCDEIYKDSVFILHGVAFVIYIYVLLGRYLWQAGLQSVPRSYCPCGGMRRLLLCDESTVRAVSRGLLCACRWLIFNIFICFDILICYAITLVCSYFLLNLLSLVLPA